MGLAGGPHCIAMCGAACGSLQKNDGSNRIWKFHLGRLVGYGSLGAVAAGSVKTLAWFSSQTQALHPLWTFFHVLVFMLGVDVARLCAPARLGRPVWPPCLEEGSTSIKFIRWWCCHWYVVGVNALRVIVFSIIGFIFKCKSINWSTEHGDICNRHKCIVTDWSLALVQIEKRCSLDWR